MGYKTLSDELRKYGYVFSLKKSVLMLSSVFITVLLLGRFFSLSPLPQFVLEAATLMFLPLFLRNTFKNRYHQKRFSDLNIYMEQFLYSFQKEGKILTVLNDLLMIFEEGPMYKTIEAARDHMLHTFNEENVAENALRIIENEYRYDGLCTIHRFALTTETLGGEYSDSILLLLESRRMWADRIYSLQQEQKVRRREIILSILTSLMLCSMIFLMAGRLNIDISHNPVTQWITVAVIISDIFIFYRADKRLTVGFIESDHTSDEAMVKQYHRFKKYDDKMIIEHLGKRAAKKSVTREIEKQFPTWLMEVSLLLQQENVAVAIFKSYKNAPAILKPALNDFIIEQKAHPDSMSAYQNFLSEFSLPEVRSSMKMLYSLSSGTGGDARMQITDIIRRNQLLMDRAEKMKNEDSLAGMYALFLAPQLTGGFKLITDMVIMLIAYLQQNALG